MSIEEVRREFPPPGAGAYAQQRSMVRDDRYGPPVRSRSAERGYGAYLGDPRDERRSRKSTVVEEKTVERRRSLSRNQKIMAGVAGAALAVGGKELFDRRQAHGRPVSRNAIQTAAIGAAGAFAAYEGAEFYAKHVGKKEEKKKKTYVAHRDKNGDVAEYYSSGEESEEPKKSRRKSLVEGALGLAGLGAAAKAVGGGRDKSRSRHGSPDSVTSRRSGRSRSRGDRKSPEGAAKFQQAAKAALLAGATEAFRVRNEPGGWGGAKGKRILTAAIGAGGIDAAVDRDPDHNSKRHILEAVVAGLAGNRLINGSRSNVEDDNRSGRGKSRSRSRGPSGAGAGLAALATAGLGALAAKKISDRSRSRSRGGDRRRGSPDSYDSRSPSPDRRHKRSKSVTDYARKGLAALGIGEAAGAADDHGRRRSEVVEETHVHRSSRRRRSPDDDYDDRRGSTRDVEYTSSRDDPYGDPHYDDSRSSVGGGGGGSRNGGSRRNDARAKDGRRNKRVAEGKELASDSESSLGSSSGDEKRIKKMKGKQLITAGLATVATIHAAHSIYQSMEKREARHNAVQEGEMTPEEARKLKAKATLQDAASVGIAALGIKGAISEIKEANEMRHEYREMTEKKEERHKKRLERQKRLGQGGDGGRRRADAGQDGEPRYDSGSRYLDSNPYASGTLPPPPVGYNGR